MGRTRTRTIARSIATLLSLVVVSALLVVDRPVTAAAASPPAAPGAHAWAPEWMVRHDGSYTEAEARDIARRYDVVAAHPATFSGLVPAMHDENPSLRILTYVNGPFAASWMPDYPESWYAHNAAGTRVKAVRFGNSLMNVHLPQWRAEVLRICNDMLATSGYDGCFLDSLGNGIIKSDYLDSAPIDPRTGQPWTEGQYITDTAGIAQYVNDQKPGVTIAANGLGSGPRYFKDNLGQLAGATDIAMAEAWLRGATASVDSWPKLAQWRQNVDMIADAEARGSGVLTVTKMWTTASEAQRRQWYDYALGSFLLGTGPHSRFFFIKDGCRPPCNGQASPLSDQWAPDGALGDPVSAYRESGGAYLRDFTKGLVVVNPGDAAVSVSLPSGNFRDQNGVVVSASLTIAAHSGRLLTADSPTPVPPAGTIEPIVTIDSNSSAPLTGIASDDSAVSGVTIQIKDASSGAWHQVDGSWGDGVADLPATLSNPGGTLTNWSYNWASEPGSYTVFAKATDDDAQTSSTALHQFSIAPEPPPTDAPYLCQGVEATIIGTPGNDTITGTSGDDVIVGLDGDDQISGLGGNDLICGDDGDDKIFAGGGTDMVWAGDGDDLVNAGQGGDTVHGGNGIDRIEGRDGPDTLFGDAGADRVIGNRGDDDLTGGTGSDVCSGGSGTADRATECEKTPWVEFVY